MGFQWATTPEQAFVPGFDEYAAQIHAAVKEWAQYFADQIALDMKANAPWQDVTGNLRASLYAEVEEAVGEAVSIIFDYGLDYGYYIAFLHAGKFDIIGPTLDKWSVIIWQRMEQLFYQ